MHLRSDWGRQWSLSLWVKREDIVISHVGWAPGFYSAFCWWDVFLLVGNNEKVIREENAFRFCFEKRHIDQTKQVPKKGVFPRFHSNKRRRERHPIGLTRLQPSRWILLAFDNLVELDFIRIVFKSREGKMTTAIVSLSFSEITIRVGAHPVYRVASLPDKGASPFYRQRLQKLLMLFYSGLRDMRTAVQDCTNKSRGVISEWVRKTQPWSYRSFSWVRDIFTLRTATTQRLTRATHADCESQRPNIIRTMMTSKGEARRA
jgi:hypothetical protein